MSVVPLWHTMGPWRTHTHMHTRTHTHTHTQTNTHTHKQTHTHVHTHTKFPPLVLVMALLQKLRRERILRYKVHTHIYSISIYTWSTSSRHWIHVGAHWQIECTLGGFDPDSSLLDSSRIFFPGPLEDTLTVTGKIKKSPWNIMIIFPDSLRKVSFSLNYLRSFFPDPLRVPYKTKVVFPGSFDGLSVRGQHSLLLTSSKLMSRYSIICYTDQHMAGCRASLFGSNVQET